MILPTTDGARWDPLFSRFRTADSIKLDPEVLYKLDRFGGASKYCSDLLVVHVRSQRMDRFEKITGASQGFKNWRLIQSYRISTSRLGIGPFKNSNRTPLGLHHIAQKIGEGHSARSVFKGRRLRGFTWDGLPNAGITTRILWLKGREPGRNLGGDVDTFERYVYIHGFSDETTLGLPHSSGCVHVESRELIELYDQLPVETPVWIQEN